ncbi:hypothetical protein LMG7141_01829 [Ralstonia condita]|uniref:Type VI secretion system tip protein VgrG n=1 Tax=Ralstonia condita TaxID=3058600 RepID=A0ABM9J9D6_9RALS|nr:phage late control D family protein [Ralstonia sp. LMG 7141]CAJ0786708.1 hypothetical protein LMG7141_01829 [Ralstonia sp. LMG 7141]
MGNRLALLNTRTVSVTGHGLPETLGKPALVFSKLSGTERLCELFEYEVELKTPDERNVLYGPGANLDTNALRGQELTVTIALDGTDAGTRQISGLVTDIVGPTPVHGGRQLKYRLTLRPWLWLATLNRDTRIFQQQTVVEILDALLGGYIFPVERRLDIARYPRREYQVQYNESDFEFFQRLTQEWGIAWHIEHSGGKHRLVLTDGNGAFGPFASPAYQTIRWQPSSDRIDEEHLHTFELHDKVVSGQWAATDYDFVKPSADLTVRAADPLDTAHANAEVREWPGDHSQPTTGNDPWKEGDQIARMRMEALRQHGRRARGAGNVRAMVPGCTFTLAHFVQSDANREYLILGAQLLIEDVADATDAAYGAMLAVFRSGLDAMDGLLDRGLSLTAAVTKLNLVPRLAWVLSDEIIPALANKLGSKTASMYIHGLSLFGGVRIVNADRSVMQLRASTLDDLKAQNTKLYGQLGRSQRREEAVAFARQAQRMARNARLVWFDPKDLAKTTGLGALELRTTADVPGVKHVKAALGSPHVNIGAIACILQGVAVYHATQSFRAAGEFDEAEKGTKLMGGLVTMVGTLAEQAGVAVSKAPTHPLVARTMRATPQEAWVTKGEKLALKGRWIGFAGATVAVGWDGYHSVDEYMKGNRLVALLYGASSISGLAAATIPLATENFLPFLFGAPVWPALVILLGVNVGLAMLDDPATLKWVQKCRFAKRPDPDKYHSMEAEWKEFVQLGIQVKDEGMQ